MDIYNSTQYALHHIHCILLRNAVESLHFLSPSFYFLTYILSSFICFYRLTYPSKPLSLEHVTIDTVELPPSASAASVDVPWKYTKQLHYRNGLSCIVWNLKSLWPCVGGINEWMDGWIYEWWWEEKKRFHCAVNMVECEVTVWLVSMTRWPDKRGLDECSYIDWRVGRWLLMRFITGHQAG